MAAFNYRHFIREIPGSTWRIYLQARAIIAPEGFDWEAANKALADALIAFLDELEPAVQARLHAELRHVHKLGCRQGIQALRNAGNVDPAMQEDFERLRNDSERALWGLLNWPDVFKAAEALLQFDLGVGRRSWKRLAINTGEPVSRDEEDLRALRWALTEVFSKRKGPPRACHIDLYNRHLDGGVQLSLYVEDDPNDLLEFVEAGMQLRPTRPALSFDLVYYPAAGVVDCCGRGGTKVQLPIVTLFARHLLKREVKPTAITQPTFFLNRLRDGFELFDGSEVDLAAHHVETIRLRRARLRSLHAPACDYWIEPPADKGRPDALACAQAHLKERDPFRSGFNIVEAVVSVYFAPSEGHKTGRVLNIEIKQSGISNLREMEAADAALAEALLKAWGVMDVSSVVATAPEPEDADAGL